MSIYLCIYSIAKLLICESTLNTTTKSYTIFATLLNTAASLVGRKKHGTKHSSDLCYPQWRPAMAHSSGNRQSVPAIAPCNGTQERHTAMAPHHGAEQWRVPWVPRPIRQSGLSPFVLLEVRTPKPKAIWGKSVLQLLLRQTLCNKGGPGHTPRRAQHRCQSASGGKRNQDRDRS